MGQIIFDPRVIECLEEYANLASTEPLQRKIVLEALNLGRVEINGLVRRVTASLGCDIKLVRKAMREAADHKRHGLNIRVIAENIEPS